MWTDLHQGQDQEDGAESEEQGNNEPRELRPQQTPADLTEWHLVHPF